ncbi:DNA cytosine methyltransferase [Veillonella caviae]|uniref:DNA cytosine methyltransferase n=1 Tax=Veillonella caviae TaxID=248316 RepID=UPI0023F11B52|nr:DNA cytosine methyltransferase [Veillonella caviae]MCI6407605.1 DNA cytosine methyltransferase [Veillonella caviae]MDY4745566.1 DNA cytosine methyltransferase [Veillonella caviae]MDY5480945.1 DNA cytosine methyltransferase [Veillonella caviae]MDY6225577.1 DNA cytosine methyltransferase [Veillonella caviae]
MQGGIREGAGRKPKHDKKITKNIYLTPNEVIEINALDLDGCKNFSQKCAMLINRGLYDIKHKSSVLKKTSNTSIKFIDLFAGIGGIRKGFEDKNTECVFSSEWDKYAAQTYEANYGEKPYGDITKINEKDIPDHDILLAGFPCQPFSNIGKRQGFAHETQGTLFFDVLRILKEKRPQAFLLENVKGLVNHDKGNTFKVIQKALSEELGYTIYHKVLDAQDFGLPQRRERIIIVGFRPDLDVTDFQFPKGSNKRVPVKDILESNPKGYSISEHLQQTYLFKKDDGKPQIVNKNSTIQVNTLVASYHKIQRLTGTFIQDGDTGLRLYSQLEAKRLMGFPDDFIVPVSRTQMYRQFGNSVAVPVIKAVADEVKKYLHTPKDDAN